MGRFKHPRKGVKMDRTTEALAAPVPPTIMEYYSDIHLDIDVLFVNKIPFLLVMSLVSYIARHCFLSMASVCRMNYSKLFLTIKQGESKLYPCLGT